MLLATRNALPRRTEREICARRYRRGQVTSSVFAHTRNRLGALARYASDGNSEGARRAHAVAEACGLDVGWRVVVTRCSNVAVHSGSFVDSACYRHSRGRGLGTKYVRQTGRRGVHDLASALASGDSLPSPGHSRVTLRVETSVDSSPPLVVVVLYSTVGEISARLAELAKYQSTAAEQSAVESTDPGVHPRPPTAH